MKMVFQQKVQEKETKLKQSEEELYARHREMKDALEKQRLELEDKKRRIESGRPLTPDKVKLYLSVTAIIILHFDDDRRRTVVSSVAGHNRPPGNTFLLLHSVIALAAIHARFKPSLFIPYASFSPQSWTPGWPLALYSRFLYFFLYFSHYLQRIGCPAFLLIGIDVTSYSRMECLSCFQRGSH